jgi:hypothetical protein
MLRPFLERARCRRDAGLEHRKISGLHSRSPRLATGHMANFATLATAGCQIASDVAADPRADRRQQGDRPCGRRSRGWSSDSARPAGSDPDPGPDRHRQGAGGPRHSRVEFARRRPLRPGELRRHPRQPAGGRAVRLRARRVRRPGTGARATTAGGTPWPFPVSSCASASCAGARSRCHSALRPRGRASSAGQGGTPPSGSAPH